MKECVIEIIECLSKQYNFSCNSALKYVGIIKKEILLPFTGKIAPTCCAIKWSYGLHTQCKSRREAGSNYCWKCQQKGVKKIGDIHDRNNMFLLDYVDNKGRKTIPWINYLEEHSLDKEMCFEYARREGVIIPEVHLKYIARRRGRPKNIKKVISDKRVFDGIHNLEKHFLEEELILFEKEGSGGKIGVDSSGIVYNIFDFGRS